MTKPAEYRNCATQMRAMAKRALLPEHAEEYLRMAEGWERLAAEAAAQEASDDAEQGAAS